METKIYSVQVDGIKFYLVEDDKNGNINFIFQDLSEAKKYAEGGASTNSYGLCMGNDEVISYGRSLGFIKDKKLVALADVKSQSFGVSVTPLKVLTDQQQLDLGFKFNQYTGKKLEINPLEVRLQLIEKRLEKLERNK